MTLIKSISGIRGTIGGDSGDALTPVDLVKFSSAFVLYIKQRCRKAKPLIVVGRDGRISGSMVNSIVVGTLQSMGANVLDLGLSTTPTVEMNVTRFKADGGIILTASHNPKQWNALKLLNNTGEFLNAGQGENVLDLSEEKLHFSAIDAIGTVKYVNDGVDYHIQKILELEATRPAAIKAKDYHVVVDGINSTGGTAIPNLLRALGVSKITVLNGTPNGYFAHNPEPIAAHLTEICSKVAESDADLGIVVDPDVDRLALVNENGELFGEEYTLVACADYILSKTPGNTVSNLSSSRALADLTEKYGGEYNASAVGEVNVVKTMKDTNAVIGGEGNGGVILPDLHYGRDSLVGVALILSLLSEKNCKLSELKEEYPEYYISKNKIFLDESMDVDLLLEKIKTVYEEYAPITIDGVKVNFPEGWIHLRKSNTEPIIRIYSEGASAEEAEKLAKGVIAEIEKLR